ncbi:MAG: threonylcarbamoyl-AMP synthase [Victivallaceae bacterium]|nr:threonylcarbamoyl-AMP synthase [Victivallaceae bacterium]
MKKYELDDLSTTVNDCAEQLKQRGSVILVPTETVYGLVCDWRDQTAINRIYSLKQRDYGKPFALFADSLAMLEQHGINIPENARRLAEKFCPGPITIIIPGSDGKTVGFRIPNQPFILALIEQYGHPLASTSANCSGMPNAFTVNEAVAMLDGEPDIAIDSGSLSANAAASTVVMVNKDKIKIIRTGPISEDKIFTTIKKRQ